MWEADKRELKASTLNKIAKVFGVSVDEVLQLHNFDADKEGNMLKKRTKKATTTQRANKINFELMAPQASKVALTGDFKSWDSCGIPMRKNKTGLWKVGVDLHPGRYEYKFIVDNEWWTDPNNSNMSCNSFGSQNSVMELVS